MKGRMVVLFLLLAFLTAGCFQTVKNQDAKPYVVSGYTFDDAGQPLVAATVEFKGTDGTVYLPAVTDADGLWTSPRLRGHVVLRAYHEDFYFRPVEVSGSTESIEMMGTPMDEVGIPYVVGGYVNDQTGRPIPGAKVYFSPEHMEPVPTDDNGFWESPTLTEPVRVSVEHPEFVFETPFYDVSLRDDGGEFVFVGLRGVVAQLHRANGNVSHHMTIQEAIDHAFAGDVVIVSDGEFEESLLIDKSIELRGQGIHRTSIAPKDGFREHIIKISGAVDVGISRLSLEGMTDANLLVRGTGSQNTSVALKNVRVRNATGDAINASNSSLSIFDSVITENNQGLKASESVVSVYGGQFFQNLLSGMHIVSKEGVHIEGSVLSNNSLGGAVFFLNEGSALSFVGNQVSENNASGVDVVLNGGSVLIYDNQFEGNMAFEGAGVRIASELATTGPADVLLFNNLFLENVASVRGGGVLVDDNIPVVGLYENTFHGNIVSSGSRAGGAIHISSDTCLIDVQRDPVTGIDNEMTDSANNEYEDNGPRVVFPADYQSSC